MNEPISVMTDFGELIATPFAGGISVDINLPDGKGSGQLAFIEATPAELQDDYPTPVHVFTYDGRDSEPVHRTDVHLDGDAMTLDPVKGTPAHNGAQAHGGDRHPADLAKAASAAANRTAGSHTDEAGRHQALGRRCLPANGSSLRDRLVGYAGGRRFLCRGREGDGRCLLEDDGDIPAGLLGPLQGLRILGLRAALDAVQIHVIRCICRIVWRPVVQCRRRVDRLELRRAPCRVLHGILQDVQEPRDHLGPW